MDISSQVLYNACMRKKSVWLLKSITLGLTVVLLGGACSKKEAAPSSPKTAGVVTKQGHIQPQVGMYFVEHALGLKYGDAYSVYRLLKLDDQSVELEFQATGTYPIYFGIWSIPEYARQSSHAYNVSFGELEPLQRINVGSTMPKLLSRDVVQELRKGEEVQLALFGTNTKVKLNKTETLSVRVNEVATQVPVLRLQTIDVRSEVLGRSQTLWVADNDNWPFVLKSSGRTQVFVEGVYTADYVGNKLLQELQSKHSVKTYSLHYTGSHQFLPISQPLLLPLVAYLKSHPTAKLRVQAYPTHEHSVPMYRMDMKDKSLQNAKARFAAVAQKRTTGLIQALVQQGAPAERVLAAVPEQPVPPPGIAEYSPLGQDTAGPLVLTLEP